MCVQGNMQSICVHGLRSDFLTSVSPSEHVSLKYQAVWSYVTPQSREPVRRHGHWTKNKKRIPRKYKGKVDLGDLACRARPQTCFLFPVIHLGNSASTLCTRPYSKFTSLVNIIKRAKIRK